MPVQVKDQDELRQLLDSLKSSDVISVQVLGLHITSTVVTIRVMWKKCHQVNLFFSTRRLLSTLEHPRRRRGGQNLSCSTWRTRSGLNISGKKWFSFIFVVVIFVSRAWLANVVTRRAPQRLAPLFSPQSHTTPLNMFPHSAPRLVSNYYFWQYFEKTPITQNPPTPGSFPANARADTWRSGGCKETATGRQPLHRQGFENHNWGEASSKECFLPGELWWSGGRGRLHLAGCRELFWS